MTIRILLIMAAMAAALPSMADEVKVGGESTFIPLTNGKPYLFVIHQGRSVKVQRIQDTHWRLSGFFAKTIRPCPPHCLQSVTPAPGVKTIGEVELFNFMENELRDGSGLLIDARLPVWYAKGTIPGSINIPFTEFTKKPDTPEMDALLKRLGAKPRGKVGLWESLKEKWNSDEAKYKTDKWDFTDAKKVVLFCNGPLCGVSPRAIRGLVAAHYPADKIFYYRGGMQMWEMWGLTTVKPKVVKQ